MSSKRATATTTRQLKIAFETQGALRQNLHQGQFSVLVECAVPRLDQPLKLALAPAVELAQFVKKDRRLTSLVVAQPEASGDYHPLLAALRLVGETVKDGKELIAVIPGRDLDDQSLRATLAELGSNGVFCLVAAAASAHPRHPRDGAGLPRCAPETYLDSTHMLPLMRAASPPSFVGATINPFKYHVADCYLQYYKLMRYVNRGADFLLTQAGWDMKKLQELQWYLRYRGVDLPVVARLRVLRPREVTELLEACPNGMVLSREFAAQLQREAAISEKQALSTQIRRLALQAVGCRLLGYSGVQLAALGDEATARAVIDAVFQAFEEFPAYPAWAAAWAEFHHGVELGPGPSRYYLFQKLNDPEHLDFHPDQTPFAEAQFPEPGGWDRTRYRLARALHAAERPGVAGRLLRRILCDCPSGGRAWHLEKTALRCAAGCPKGLEDAPCEASRPDGTCEFGHRPCFFHQVLALANWQGQLDRFEVDDEAR